MFCRLSTHIFSGLHIIHARLWMKVRNEFCFKFLFGNLKGKQKSQTLCVNNKYKLLCVELINYSFIFCLCLNKLHVLDDPCLSIILANPSAPFSWIIESTLYCINKRDTLLYLDPCH